MKEETAPIQTTALKPCPFCGGRAFVTPAEDEGGGFYAYCDGDDCFVCVGEGYDRSAMPDHEFPTREAAAEAWNRRVQNV